MTQTAERAVAKKTSGGGERDRVDLRAEPAWIARIERQAKRFGLNVSAYIRQAVSERLERDEQTDPALAEGSDGGGGKEGGE